ncbi:TraR/DksA family transcriptional regulator [Nocardioides pacificus]
MTDPDVRDRLLAEQATTAERVARLRGDFSGMVDASESSNADDEHDPEGATIAFERSQLSTLIRQGELHLEEVDAALGRVEDGSFGICARCGRPIPAERLAVRPIARTCVTCPS